MAERDTTTSRALYGLVRELISHWITTFCAGVGFLGFGLLFVRDGDLFAGIMCIAIGIAFVATANGQRRALQLSEKESKEDG